jgi:hypothetical protein
MEMEDPEHLRLAQPDHTVILVVDDDVMLRNVCTDHPGSGRIFSFSVPTTGRRLCTSQTRKED